MPFNLPPLGQATDIQVIPRGTILHYRGIPFELIEDVRAMSGMSIARVDAARAELTRCAQENATRWAAEAMMADRDTESQSPPA